MPAIRTAEAGSGRFCTADGGTEAAHPVLKAQTLDYLTTIVGEMLQLLKSLMIAVLPST